MLFNTGTTATTYTISQVVPAGEIQSAPFNTKGVYSQLSLAGIGAIASSVAAGVFFDGGDPDVAYAISLDVDPYEIAYALGNGQGGFGTPVLVALPVPAGSPTLASPTAGGANDAFIVAGIFGSTSHDDIAYVAPMASGGEVVVIYDIDANTIVDLIEITSAGAETSFGANMPSTASPWTINNVAVGDLNNDGYDDLAISAYGGVFTLIDLQDTTLTSTWTVDPATLANPLGTPTLLGSSSSVAYDAGVAIADFNQDGNLDLVTVGVQYIPTSTSSDRSGTTDSFDDMTVAATIQLTYGTGDGVDYTAQTAQTFQEYSNGNIDRYFSSSSSSPTFPIPFGVAATDINGDGIPDLVLNGYTDTLQPAVIAFEQSSGTFTNVDTFPFPDATGFDVNAGSSLVAAGILGIDLNGDGYDDIAAVDPNNGQMMLLTTAGASLTTSQAQTDLILAGGALPQFAAADFGQSGYPDLIVPGANDGTSQSAPVLILNGTINVATFSITPTNGEVLGGQNFADISVTTTSSVADDVVANAQVQSDTASVTTFTISGEVYVDRNQNGHANVGELGFGGITLYIDTDDSGHFNPAIDPYTMTNNLGYYAFTGLAPGQTYHIGVANLPSSYAANELIVSIPPTSQAVIINRDLSVNQLWSIPQSMISTDPLTPVAIELSSISLRQAIGFRPIYVLIGEIPSGMTIDPYSGQILWTPPISYAGLTVTVSVRIQDSSSPSALGTQLNQFSIHVNTLSLIAAYIRDVFGALLDRLPSAVELAQWTNRLESGTSRLNFVSTIARSTERYEILTDQTYLTVLDREPTSQELASALQMFQSGGNSDRLTRQLLTSPEFVQEHEGDRAYVNAVNEILTFATSSPQLTAMEVAWLRMGGSRKRLVDFISTSRAATMAKARQLAMWYFGQPTSTALESLWAEGSGGRNSEQRFVDNPDSCVAGLLQGIGE